MSFERSGQSIRIGALDLSQLVSEKTGSFAYREFFEFRAVEGDAIHLWYMNSGGKGPSVEITLQRDAQGR